MLSSAVINAHCCTGPGHRQYTKTVPLVDWMPTQSITTVLKVCIAVLNSAAGRATLFSMQMKRVHLQEKNAEINNSIGH